MPQLLKQAITKVITKDGECEITISLDLNINLNTDGLSISSGSKASSTQEDDDDDKVNWVVPDFGGVGKVEFGKKAT